MECSKFRRIASQCVAAFAANTVMFTIGNSFGMSTILLAELYKKDAEIFATQDELSWFSSWLFLTPIGAIMNGVIGQNFGSKMSMLIGSSFFIVSWILFYLATDVPMLYIAVGLLAMFFIAGPTVTYVAEISEPDLRSAILSTTSFSMALGSFVTVTMGAFLYWRTITLINLTISVIGFAMICFIPDSPHWLANKNRFHKAEKSLAWLRGWVSLWHVNSEVQTLKDAYYERIPVSNGSKSRDSANSDANKTVNHIKYYERSFYIPLCSVIYMFTIRNLSGCLLIKIFSGIIFQKISAPSSEYLTAFIFALRVSGTLTYICCVKTIGKKKLACFTLALTGVLLLAASISMILQQKQYDDAKIYLWISIVSILSSNFVSCAGYDSIVNDLNGELFPSKFRNVGAGIGNFFNSVVMALTNRLFLKVVDFITLEGSFMIFTVACFIGSLTFYLIIPVTEGKSLIEIEDHYNKNTKLKNQGF
ncbi:hypothetical protein QAD02_019104 [Eretmocerus hayati]|uniref:Uncharacterized protein n=1 Tax=Eretmocerus hayati TaxID=131215 RepID=A0ACC2PIN0_9HYME|nr:hypothetical protein QAD02_019104 [Eretmocerus hayati]